MQVDIAHEETKFGMDDEQIEQLLISETFKELENVRICGLMGIGSITDDMNQTQKEFHHLQELFERIKERFFQNKDSFKHLSMGMSHDYEVAISEGSTLVRIGSSIFGLRDYSSKN